MNQTNAKDQNTAVVKATKILLIALLAIALVIIIYSILNSVGTFGRLDTAVRSDNFSVSENSLCLFKYQAAQQEYYYTWLYDQYGLTSYGLSGTYGDVNTFLNAMIYNTTTSNPHTFDETAYSTAESTLVYCEGAKAAGVELDDDDKADIEDYMDNLKAMADANGVSFKSYLSSWIGIGVSERDVRKALELSVLASKYATQLNEEMSAAVTDDEKVTYRDENKGSFYTTKYTSYVLPNESLVETAKACTDVAGIKTMLVNYYMEQNFETNYKSIITDKSVETTATADETRADVLATIQKWEGLSETAGKFDVTSTDAYVAAGYSLATAIDTDIKTQINKINTTGSSAYADVASEDATDLQKWLFAEGRATGDVNVITVSSTSTATDGTETTTTTNTWYLVGSDVMVLDTAKTRSAYYTVLSDDAEGTENGKTADEKWSAFEAGEHTGEKFEEAFGATLNESLSETSLADELNEWLFNTDRKDGDYSRVTVKQTGSDNTVTETEYVIFFVKENEENWKVSATSSIVSDKTNTWYDEMVEKYHVVSDYEAETEAATEAA